MMCDAKQPLQIRQQLKDQNPDRDCFQSGWRVFGIRHLPPLLASLKSEVDEERMEMNGGDAVHRDVGPCQHVGAYQE